MTAIGGATDMPCVEGHARLVSAPKRNGAIPSRDDRAEALTDQIRS
jgi:hypothetical protein